MRRRPRHVLVALLVVAATIVPAASAAAAVPFSEEADAIWMTNGVGDVRAIAAIGNDVYVGGSFTAVRDGSTGSDVLPAYLAAFNRVTGERKAAFLPQLDGSVRAIAASPDASILYIGGTYIEVDGARHKKLAGLDPVTGRRDPSFDVTLAGGGVFAVAVSPDGDIFVGGAFTGINGQSRTGLARLAPDGTPRAWNPVLADGVVEGLEIDVDRGRLYVAGSFSQIANTAATRHLVAFSLATGALDESFLPKPGYEVNAVDVTGDKVFAALGGPGGRAIVYDASTGSKLRAWSTDGDIRDVKVVDGVAYFAGHWFRTFGGQPSARIQGVNVSSLTLDNSFIPAVGAPVFDIEYDGTYLWLGGAMTAAPPVAANGFARFSAEGYVPPPDTTAPTRPGRPRVSQVMTTTATLAWRPSSDDVGVSHYDVFANGTQVGTTEHTRFIVSGLEPETEYRFRVRAVDYWGNRSVASRKRTRTTAPDTERPAAPSNLKVLARSRKSVRLGWAAATDNVGVVEYRVYRNGSLIAVTGNTRYKDRGLSPATRYRWKVRAVDAAGNVSTRSNKVKAKTKPVFISRAASWRYLDDASTAPARWKKPNFDHSGWPIGRAELGYGDGGERTVLNQGPITTYFRRPFKVPDAAAFGLIRIRLVRDDGAVVYLNGVELLRENMPAGAIDHETLAESTIAGAGETEWTLFDVPVGALRSGTNIIAVELHQVGPESSDLSFALELRLLP